MLGMDFVHQLHRFVRARNQRYVGILQETLHRFLSRPEVEDLRTVYDEVPKGNETMRYIIHMPLAYFHPGINVKLSLPAVVSSFNE